MTPDPIEAVEGESVTLTVSMSGSFETGGNATTIQGADLDWGDGSNDPLIFSKTMNETRTHVYKEPGLYSPSARMVQDYKYDGKGSCSYQCDARRAAVAIVYPKKKPPYLHTIAQGETLASIAAIYGLETWKDIFSANKEFLASPNHLEVEQKILIPASSQSAKSSWQIIKSAIGSIEKALEHDKKTTVIEGLLDISIDLQLESQIEHQRENLLNGIRQDLSQGAPGVLVTVSVYTNGPGKTPVVQKTGIGETPVIARANFQHGDRLSAEPPGILEPEESYVSLYQMVGGQLISTDYPPGYLVGVDAQVVQALAEKEKQNAARAKAIEAQLGVGAQKQAVEQTLRDISASSRLTAGARQTADEGPAGRPPNANRGTSGQGRSPEHPTIDHGTGLPLPEGSGSGGGNGGNGGGGRGGGGRGGGSGSPKEHIIEFHEPSVIEGKPGPHPGENIVSSSPPGMSAVQHPPLPVAPTPKAPTEDPRGKPKVSSSSQFGTWGLPHSRAWIDINKDGFKDFCRIVKSSRSLYKLVCTLATGNAIQDRYTGKSYETQLDRANTKTVGSFVDANGDGVRDFCRVIPTDVKRGYLSCVLLSPDKFGTEIRSQTTVQIGLESGRMWLDLDGDGKADFCTMMQLRPGYGKLSCTLATESGFSDVPIESKPLHWRGPGFRGWIVSETGDASFCTVAGSGDQYIDCTVFAGKKFGDTYRDLLAQR